MQKLSKGTFFGNHQQITTTPNAVITDTVYTHNYVDWHYHERPYFTFLLQGKMLEVGKKHRYHCVPGTLLYHHWQDAHYNIKSAEHTRGFHIDLDETFFQLYDLPNISTAGSIEVSSPFIKTLFRQIYLETKQLDQEHTLAIDQLLINVFDQLSGHHTIVEKKMPSWLKKVIEMLHDCPCDQLSLADIAASAGVHPVHLSRQFPKFFGHTIGNYIRMLRAENALNLIQSTEQSITAIAYQSGYADQSHLIRSFKKIMKVTPFVYQKKSS